MSKLLEVFGLCKRFSGITALDKVNIDIEKGKIFYLDKPIDLKNHVPHYIAKLGIARTFQGIRLFPNMTVIENVMVAASIREKTSFFDIILKRKNLEFGEASIFSQSLELLHFVGLSDKINDIASNLAYGEQRKLEIARALATVPVLLLLDEPAAGMNASETKELVLLIREIKDRGVTIFLIEHDMKLVMSISDKVFVINYGKNIASGVPLQIQKNKQVIEAYLGEKTE